MNKFLLVLEIICFIILESFANDVKLNITPSIFEKNVRRGEKIEFNFQVENKGMQELILKGSLSDFVLDENGVLHFGKGISDLSCIKWLDFFPKEITLSPGAKQKVLITGQVPFKGEGSYYAALLFSVVSPSHNKIGNLRVRVKPGLLINLTMNLGIKINADLSSFNIKQTDNSTIFEISVLNTGNVHIRPKGSIAIFNNKNRIIDRLNISDNTFILPNRNRIFKIIWNNPQKRDKNKKYIAECRLAVPGLGKSLTMRKEFAIIER